MKESQRPLRKRASKRDEAFVEGTSLTATEMKSRRRNSWKKDTYSFLSLLWCLGFFS